MAVAEFVERTGEGWLKMKSGIISLLLVGGLGWAIAGCSARSSVPSVPPLPSPPTPSSAPESTESGQEAKGTLEAGEAPIPSSSGGPERVEASREKDPPTRSDAGREGGRESGEKVLDGPPTAEEQRAGMDGELDSSLSEFDELLLREQELLEQRREEAAAAAEGTGEGSLGSMTSPGKEDDAAGVSEGRNEPGSGGSPDRPAGEPVSAEPGVSEGQQGQTPNGRVPPDVGDGSDDDIVARQLREAAMSEEDPDLREKLWDEYRAYKKGSQKD